MDSTDTNPQTQKSSGLPWVLFALTLALGAAAVYFGYGLLQEEKGKNATAIKTADEATGQLKDLQAKLTALETEKGALAAERDALSTDLKAKEEELAKLKATYDDLNSKLDDEIKKGEISLSQTGDRIQVDLVDKILFDSGEAEITAHGQEVLSRIGGAIANVPNKLIQVAGHTDDSPVVNNLKEKFPTNWELSASRAVNVVRFLSEKAGVPARRLVAAGFGQYHPVATNRDHAGRARNRRIEILLTPALDPKQDDSVVAKVTPAKATAPAKAEAKADAKNDVKPASASAPAKPATSKPAPSKNTKSKKK